MIQVAGTWELGWSAPHTEMTQWWSVMRSFEIPMLHMTPVSGLDHKLLREHTSFDEMLDEAGRDLTPVFVHEDGECELRDFVHPDNALYVFGKANFSPFAAYGKGELSVRIDCQKMGMLWPHQALAIVMYDRSMAL